VIDSSNIDNGFYSAKPTFAGLIRTANGHSQFAIEVAIPIDGQTEPVVMTLASGLDTSKPIQRKDGSTTTQLEITMTQAELCGIDTSRDIRQWGETLDTEAQIRVKVEAEEYEGKWRPKLKGIYGPGGAGGLIKKQAMDDASAAAVASQLNAQIKALRAKREAQGGGAAKTRPQPTRPTNGARPQSRTEEFDPGDRSDDSEIPF
jgi:hypothetical protein